MRNGDRIVQMIPAAGYYAAYRDGDELTYNPVAVWVVIEDQQGGGQHVDGADRGGHKGTDRRAATGRASSNRDGRERRR